MPVVSMKAAFIIWTVGIGFIIGLIFLVRTFVLLRIKQALNLPTNKIPMVMCERNHLYPEADALTINLPELSAPLKICPFCYRENLDNADRFKA